MTRKNALLIGFVLLVIAIALALWTYPQLPGRVPSHWDMAGNINGYSSRFVTVALMPVTIGLTWILMVVLPVISPRGFRLEESAEAFYLSTLGIMVVLLVLEAPLLRGAGTGVAPPLAAVTIPIGALFIILGALMGRLKKNFFIGIRTPWTLASDDVWARTNAFGGRLMVICGFVIVVAGFFVHAAFFAILGSSLVVAILPIVYSYLLYKRIEGFESDGGAGQ